MRRPQHESARQTQTARHRSRTPRTDRPVSRPDGVDPRRNSPSTYAEFRNRDRVGLHTEEDAIWKYLTETAGIGNDPRELLNDGEQRVLSKATSAAGGYLVPADLEAQILSVVHARSSIARLAREIDTASGVLLNLGTASAQGTASWTAENAAFAATGESWRTGDAERVQGRVEGDRVRGARGGGWASRSAKQRRAEEKMSKSAACLSRACSGWRRS